MERAVSVSRSDKCPICGRSDWCRFLPANSNVPGARLVNCKRDTSCQDQISHVDGKYYLFIKTCGDRSSLYIDQEIKEKEKHLWKMEKGYHGHDTAEKERTVVQQRKTIVQEETVIQGVCKVLSDHTLDLIYRKFLSYLHLSQVHRAYLQKENWSDALIETSMARTLPPADKYAKQRRKSIAKKLVDEFGPLNGVPGFYQDRQDQTWTFAGKSGLVFPLLNRKGEIYRLRLRVDYPDIDERGKVKNKYQNFSSFREEKREDGTYYNYYWNGTQANSQIGLYNKYTKDYYVVYITEGEKKSMVTNYVLGHPVICLPGVNCFGKPFIKDSEGVSMIDHCVKNGAGIFVIAYDADKAYNQKVLDCEQALVERLYEENAQIKVAIADWNIGFGKGIDDILGTGIRPNVTMVQKEQKL